MSPNPCMELANRYYDAFRNRGDFGEVPMADDLEFRSPMMNLEGAAAFRQALGGLMARFQGIEVRHQARDGDDVLTVYDFDMGAGPVPMAEVLRIADGRIKAVELLFDPSRMAPPA